MHYNDSSYDHSQSEFGDRPSLNSIRPSTTDKMSAHPLRGNTFKGVVNNLAAGGPKNSKMAKQEEAAQTWEGRPLYEMDANAQPREGIATHCILFDQLPKDVRILAMACTTQQTFLVTTQGNVYSWGNPGEALGRRTPNKVEARTPTQIPELKDIVNITTGDNHVLALDLHGQIYAWGNNLHGQVGLGPNYHAVDSPARVESVEDVAQIYAGPTCSFAVAKNGILHAWGQNSYGQLAQGGSDVFLPQKVTNAPWAKEQDIAFVTAKSHVGYIFATLNSTKQRGTMKTTATSDGRKNDLEFKELKEKYDKLVLKNAKLKEHLVGKVPSAKLERNFEEDPIIKQLKEDERISREEIAFIDQRTKHLKEEITGVQNDLASIQHQLKDIELRENQLSDELQNLDNELLKRRDKANARDLLRQKKTAEDLARANEQIKNMMQQKLSDRTDKDRDLHHESSMLEKKRIKLSERVDMVLKLIVERKTTIAQGAFEENQNEITGLIHALYELFAHVKKTTVEEVSKTQPTEKGLLEVLTESNDQLVKFKKEADKLKVNPSDALYKITSEILDIFQDNLNTRLKLNEFCTLLYAQLNEQQNDPKLLEPKKKPEDKKKVRDAKIAQLKQKYNVDQAPQRHTHSIGPTMIGQRLNNSGNINNSIQRGTGSALQRSVAQSIDGSPETKGAHC